MEVSTEEYLKHYYIHEDDLALLKEIWERIKDDMDGFVDAFYDWVRETVEGAEELFNDPEKLRERKALTKDYWSTFFYSPRTKEYIERRIRIGVKNAELGQTIDRYFTGITKIYVFLSELLERCGVNGSKYMAAFNKLMTMETSIVIKPQSEYAINELNEKNKALRDLSTPIARLQKNLLFLPLVGLMDTNRLVNIMNAILTNIASTQAKVFIIDIGGIGMMDTAVADYLIRITKATALMGCQTILSGLSGKVAQTIVELGIDTGGLSTTGNLQDALNRGLNIVGAKIAMKH